MSAPGDNFLKNTNNEEIEITCTFDITNGDASRIFTDHELQNATVTLKFSKVKLGDNPGMRHLDKITDNADAIAYTEKWANNFKKILDFAVPLCEVGAGLMTAISALTLVLFWAPFGIGEFLKGVFLTAYNIWNTKFPLDVTSVKFWCNTVACTGTNWASAILPAGTNSILAESISSFPDPRQNYWLSFFSLPPCVTGMYNYHQVKKVILKAESYCLIQQALVGKDLHCSDVKEDFDCLYGSPNVILGILGSMIMGLFVGWIMDLLIKAFAIDFVICNPAKIGLLTNNAPECYAYVLVDAGSFVSRITDSKNMIKKHADLDSKLTLPPNIVTPQTNDIYCGYNEEC